MSPILRSVLTLLAAVVIVAAFIAGSDELRTRRAQPTPAPTPKPGIVVKPKEINTVPQVSATRRRGVTREIARTLRTFYTNAFVRPSATPPPERTPVARPMRRVASMMTTQARRAIAKDSGPFDQAADLAVYSGTVSFSGLLTFDGRRPLESFIDVSFAGVGVPVGRSAPQVNVKQKGRMILRRTSDGWLVDGFDLKFSSSPVPTPSVS